MSDLKYITNQNDNDYKVKLSSFEGPLDLLLHLIKDAKIDIKDIFLSEITEQYLTYLSNIEEVDVEKAGEFIEMAATLIEIKSKKLLPVNEKLIEDEESEESKLIRKLEEYKIIKEASEELKPLENINSFYKKPDDSVGDYRYVLKDMKLDGLLDAFAHLMFKITEKAQEIKPKRIEKDRFTVAQKISQIKDVIMVKKKFKFTELFEADYSKSEAINTFLAVLELLKLGQIRAEQDANFEDITITKREDGEQNG